MRNKTVSEFKHGLVTAIEDHSIPFGAASDSLNWLSKVDRIELSRGYQRLGTAVSGVGTVTGLHVAFKADGTQILLRKRARKLEYYDTTTQAWLECGTDVFPEAAASEHVTFSNYTPLAGNQVIFGSPRSGPYKLMSANPGYYADMYDEAKNFKGWLKVKQNRTFLWGRVEDKTGIYGSYVDNGIENYTTVSSEAVGTGDGVDTTFSGVLNAKLAAIGDSTTQFDISNPAGQTFRYRFDGTGTDPGITAAAFPVGLIVAVQGQNFNAANNGVFVVTGSGADYFEVINPSGVVEADKTIGSGSVKKASNLKATVFGIAIKVDGTVVLTDDFSGNLKDSDGVVRGSINYMTGQYAITFGTAPGNALAITADYQWENSTDEGILAFTKSDPRTAGQGFIFRQDDGGEDVMSIESYGDVEYCLHRLKTWALTLSADDTDATNLIYRDRVGIPNIRAAVATGFGVFYVDDLNEADPKFRLLTLQQDGASVIPLPVSDQLNLKDYRFDQAAAHEWGDEVRFACRHKDSPANDTEFVYNKRDRFWHRTDNYVSAYATYNGALVAGDSISYNVYELASGFDADGDTIANYWDTEFSDLDTIQLKKTKKLWLEGEISRDQSIEFYVSIDNSTFTLAGTQRGTDDNVDTAARTVIGSDAVGQSTIGGQTSTQAHHYLKELRLTAGKFQKVKLRIKATAIGYASVSSYTYQDILLYGERLPQKYRSVAN